MSKDLPMIPQSSDSRITDNDQPDLAASASDDAVVQPQSIVSIKDESLAVRQTNWNPVINAMADAQGIEVGSWDWMLGGIAPWSGSSGEHSSYGWSHTHKLTPHYVRSVLANYGHRRAYYRGAPFRQFQYANACRPHGWVPESHGDMPDGTTIYMTSNGPVRVSGPDAEHLWLTPLFALIDDPNPIEVETGLGSKMPSNMVARWLATLLVSAAVGMVRDQHGDGTSPYPWTYGDRATGRLLHTIIEGHKRGCLLAEDVSTAAFFIRDIVLAFYERGPGIHAFGEGRPGQFPMGLFNGLNWILPACYDTSNALRNVKGLKDWADRYMTLVLRWSQWMVDMNEVLPHECFRADRLFIDDSFTQNGVPVDSISQLIKPEDFYFTFDFMPWAYRAVDIAAAVTDNKKLKESRDAIADQYRSDQARRQWLVGADGEYVG